MVRTMAKTLALLGVVTAVSGASGTAHAAKFYQTVIVPAAVPAPVYYGRPVAYYAPAVMQPAPVLVQPAAVVVPAAVVPVPQKVVNRGLFRTSKETVTGRPGHERYHYHEHRLLAPNYHYTVKNDQGRVRERERRTW